MTEARIVSGLWSESATANLVRPGWHQTAECRGNLPLFFAARFDSPRPSRKVRLAIMEAKSVCARCAVRNVCLDFAIESGEDYGIWGGLTPGERDMVRRRRTA